MDAAQIQAQLNSNIYFNLISFSLLFYDFFLTLDAEISRYWGAPIKFPTILFFANRYGTLFGNIPAVIQNFWTTESTPRKIMVNRPTAFVSSNVLIFLRCAVACCRCVRLLKKRIHRCQHLETYHQYFIIATQILVGLMLLLRTYALYERSKRVLGFMIFVAVASIAVAIWSVLSGKAGDSSENLHLYVGCAYGFTKTQGISLATAWAGSGIFDFMVFLLTLYKGLGSIRPRGANLLTTLLRDGSIYFGVMAASNLSNILTFVVSELVYVRISDLVISTAQLGGPYTRDIATTFTNIISSLMISRLMLNLRDPSLLHIMSGEISEGPSVITGLVFTPYPDAIGRGAPETYIDRNEDIELLNRRNPPAETVDSTQDIDTV
ncbi:hypothetical protein MVEN_02286300 [Mycena venus]|uniref:DUF6533 domain-containing protein n=1 Tax=Mycena venus TaxID=2733690 RepID=A0A8H6X5U7_9AGAR|nr:hypothetical protein MVEN_02286300 [Mycena venus]